MKRYQCHKTVEAAAIEMCHFEDDGSGGVGVNIEGSGLTMIAVHPGFRRPDALGPSRGDYLVRYQPDGYLSWSPKAVFEAGYSEIGASGDYRERVRQERADLEEKLTKLERFIAGVEKPDTLLTAQADVMRSYLVILDARIRSFPDGPVLGAAELIAAGKAARAVATEGK